MKDETQKAKKRESGTHACGEGRRRQQQSHNKTEGEEGSQRNLFGFL